MKKPPLLIDLHLDLSLNAVDWRRDLRRPIDGIRRAEAGLMGGKGRGRGTVAFPEMRQGGVRLCVATLIGGCMKPPGPVATWPSPEQAWAATQGQLAWYRAMEVDGQMRQIRDTAGLDAFLADKKGEAIGYILSLEGADSVRSPQDLAEAWNDGLRAIGPAHYGKGRYAEGHDRTGGLPAPGRELLREMDRLGFILDVTHLSDRCLAEALDLFGGPVWASHSNCRALVEDPRQLHDDQIRALTHRHAVIGVALDAWMLVPGWTKGLTLPSPTGVSLGHVADHIDHICQLAGDALHVAIGSDLDGGYGTEQTPFDLDTIADLARLAPILRQRGYTASDVENVFSANVLRFLRQAWKVESPVSSP